MKRLRPTSKQPSRSKANDEKAEHCRANGAGQELTRAPVPDSSIDSATAPMFLAPRDLGAKDDAFFVGITRQILDAVKNSEEIVSVDLKFAMSFVKDFKPRNHIEGALAAQMAVGHL